MPMVSLQFKGAGIKWPTGLPGEMEILHMAWAPLSVQKERFVIPREIYCPDALIEGVGYTTVDSEMFTVPLTP